MIDAVLLTEVARSQLLGDRHYEREYLDLPRVSWSLAERSRSGGYGRRDGSREGQVAEPPAKGSCCVVEGFNNVNLRLLHDERVLGRLTGLCNCSRVKLLGFGDDA